MGMVNRRKRQRLNAPESLPEIWNRGEPPPAWAYEPGEHHDDIIGLYFFHDYEGQLDARTHPHREAWADAMSASAPVRESTSAPIDADG